MVCSSRALDLRAILGAMRLQISSAVVAMGLAAGACSAPRPPAMHVEVPRDAFTADPDAITVSWIGHATMLVGIRGHWFLTDPMFSERIAGVVRRDVEPA